ncbi:uncharacterized protein DSM5745_09266 [Aspergillus mulundensis]|uniref:Uncharacterized protein n=1 Tax=Aspergillus mulundensis TaxID=1810919 RepID=A0A3D8R0F3_9EURO|nr:hypothetical protein DSM5745_09266 [Aspergillus mulundensis]RDW67400.1 hypothetical protein DSM5745_09266 [Aspergillus mulundensis]
MANQLYETTYTRSVGCRPVAGPQILWLYEVEKNEAKRDAIEKLCSEAGRRKRFPLVWIRKGDHSETVVWEVSEEGTLVKTIEKRASHITALMGRSEEFEYAAHILGTWKMIRMTAPALSHVVWRIRCRENPIEIGSF